MCCWLQEDTQVRCDKAWREVTAHAEALVADAQEKASQTCAAADQHAAGVRKRAEEEAKIVVSVRVMSLCLMYVRVNTYVWMYVCMCVYAC